MRALLKLDIQVVPTHFEGCDHVLELIWVEFPSAVSPIKLRCCLFVLIVPLLEVCAVFGCLLPGFVRLCTRILCEREFTPWDRSRFETRGGNVLPSSNDLSFFIERDLSSMLFELTAPESMPF